LPDKLQLIALVRPSAMLVIEHVVDVIIAREMMMVMLLFLS
jgi:hypothetical protein